MFVCPDVWPGFFQIFDQDFDQRLGEGKYNKHTVQYYLAF